MRSFVYMLVIVSLLSPLIIAEDQQPAGLLPSDRNPRTVYLSTGVSLVNMVTVVSARIGNGANGWWAFRCFDSKPMANRS